MRGIAARLATAALVAAILVPGFSQAATAICGRPDYPSATAYAAGAVLNATLWEAFRAHGGFAGGAGGQGIVEVSVTDGALVDTATVREGSGSGGPIIVLAVRVRDASGATVAAFNLSAIEVGRMGGNLTLAAWVASGALEIFWRWAYLPCDEEFPTVYAVYHARVAGGVVADDNTPVYFEALRPRRGPPTDLIILVTAGLAASAIFLYARHRLRRRDPDAEERTVK